MGKNLKKWISIYMIYMYIYIYKKLNHFAVCLKPCKSQS